MEALILVYSILNSAGGSLAKAMTRMPQYTCAQPVLYLTIPSVQPASTYCAMVRVRSSDNTLPSTVDVNNLDAWVPCASRSADLEVKLEDAASN